MDMKVKNRAWVKNAVIVFLLILLVLTFFSNTIMNRSLPEVSAKNVTEGPITARVRGSGTVTASGSYEVRATETRKISAVRVRAGQEVEVGDVLFLLDTDNSEELEQAREELRQLELSKQRTSASAPSFDYSLAERHIEQTREKLDEAREAEALAYLAMESNANAPTDRIKEANARVEALEEQQEAAQSALEEAQLAFANKQANAQQRVDEALNQLNALLDNPPAEEETDGDDGAQSEYQQKLAEAQAALEAAQTAQAALTSETDTGLVEAQSVLTSVQASLQSARDELDALLGQAGSYAAAYAEAKRAVQELEDELFEQEYNLRQQKNSDGQSASGTYIELQDLNYKIEQAKAKIEQLTEGKAESVTAPAAGIVDSILVTAGDTPAKDDILCMIQVPDLGYTLSFSVTTDQARRLRPGDEASVNYWWGGNIQATLSGIRPDPQNPQTNKLLVFDVSGNVNPGTELSLSVGSKSQNYDTVIPNSAIRSDTNGSFVLKIEAKNSPLGNRYYAVRVDVTVLASDDTNSAVVGELGYGDFVICSSSAPIKSGDMVRMTN